MAHFLVVYDRAAGRIVRKKRFSRSGDAMRARFAAEAEFAGRTEIEIVVLTAESEAALKITHGRYFLGLKELADRLAPQ